MYCQHCGEEIRLETGPGRRDVCPRCGADLRSCRHCSFYDPGYADGCREPQADRILDRDRSNFCDFFRATTKPPAKQDQTRRQEAKAKLDALFK